MITSIKLMHALTDEKIIPETQQTVDTILNRVKKNTGEINYQEKMWRDGMEGVLTISALEMIKNEIFYPDEDNSED